MSRCAVSVYVSPCCSTWANVGSPSTTALTQHGPSARSATWSPVPVVATGSGVSSVVSALLTAAGVHLREDRISRLVHRTEGWPAGIYLAALSLRDHADPDADVDRFAGASRHVADLGLMVAASHRRQGVGTALLRQEVTWSRESRIRKLELHVFPWNEPALGLYESFGFVREGYRKRHYERGGELVDAILMAYFVDGVSD